MERKEKHDPHAGRTREERLKYLEYYDHLCVNGVQVIHNGPVRDGCDCELCQEEAQSKKGRKFS